MNSFYEKKDFCCVNFNKQKDPLIELLTLKQKESFNKRSKQYKIVFILEGELSYWIDESLKYRLEKGDILFVPLDKRLEISANINAKILILRMEQIHIRCTCKEQWNDHYIDQNERCLTNERYFLKTNQTIDVFIQSLWMYLNKNPVCQCYIDVKIKELFFLFRASYSKKELCLFFQEMQNRNLDFFYFVTYNHQKYKTVNDLAQAMQMNIQTFERRFKEVFGMPAYQWMKKEKISNIVQAICGEETPLKVLASRFFFASNSSFSEFCRKNMGYSPSVLRKNARFDVNEKQKDKMRNRI